MLTSSPTTSKCSRCGGLMVEWYHGDLACINCGHIVYVVKPYLVRVKALR